MEIHLEYPTWFEKWTDTQLRSWLHSSPTIPLTFVVVTWIVCACMILVAWLVGRSLQRMPGRLQNAIELVVQVGDEFVRSTVGSEGWKYTPFILTLFFFIFLGSLFGIIPGFASPTANINTTAALAIVAFVYVNYQAIRSVGLKGFIKAFFPSPIIPMGLIIGPLEILSHLIRPVTLAVRLFGNIFGEDVMIAVLTGFGIAAFKASHVIPLPAQLPIMLFSIFTDLVQAAVFCMLTTIYIALLCEHAGHENHGHDAHEDHGAFEPSAVGGATA